MGMRDKWKDFIEKFTILKSAPRELWVVYVINIIEYIAYTLMQFSLMLWLMKDLNQSDEHAAYVLMVWGMILSAMMVVAGMITDGLGIKRSFWLGYAFCVLGRLFIAFDMHYWAALIIGLGPIAVGMSLMSPVVAAAIRRYTDKNQRSMAFSMFYVLMNVGYAVGGWGFDVIRAMVKNWGGSVSMLGYAMTEFQFLFFLSGVLTVAGLLIIQFFLRRGVAVDEDSGEITTSVQATKTENPAKIFIEVVREKPFWLFILFLLFLVGVKSVFYHMHYTLPPFAERYIGEGAKFGTAWGFLNPFIIVVFVPFIGALTQKISSFKMIVLGSFISAFATFILCIPGEVFQPLADSWLGSVTATLLAVEGDLHPWYFPLILFTIVFTIGEGIWSPRLFEYTASIAPKGREGSYMSLSILPWFASKPVVAGLQAWILPAYAPEGGPFDPVMFWGVIGLTALSSPILVLLFKKWIQTSGESQPQAEAT